MRPLSNMAMLVVLGGLLAAGGAIGVVATGHRALGGSVAVARPEAQTPGTTTTVPPGGTATPIVTSPVSGTDPSATGSVSPPTTVPPITQPTVTIGSWTGVEPDTIWFSADGGNVVSDITWSYWNDQSAVGTGTWGYENCDPSCAQGTVTPYSATITLTDPSDGQFTRLTEAQSGPEGSTSAFTLPDDSLNGASSGKDEFDQ